MKSRWRGRAVRGIAMPSASDKKNSRILLDGAIKPKPKPEDMKVKSGFEDLLDNGQETKRVRLSESINEVVNSSKKTFRKSKFKKILKEGGRRSRRRAEKIPAFGKYLASSPRRAISVLLVCMVLLVSIPITVIKQLATGERNDKSTLGVVFEGPDEVPYKTIVPQTNTEGLQKAYDSEFNLYSFEDRIDLVPIAVSQQPLPEELKSKKAKLQDVTESFVGISTTEFLETKHGIVILSRKINGGAIVTLRINDLLIFVTADEELSSERWLSYIDGMTQFDN